MKKIKPFLRIIFLILVSLVISFFTYIFCHFIAEKYFFDKLFYKKSSEYGYCHSLNNKNCQERYQYNKLLNSKSLITQINSANNYKIVIMGDSYVLGVGIKNEQRFAKILEKKLNKIKPTKIITFSDTSMSPINYLNWYEQIKNTIKANLYIFALVSNDAYIRPDSNGTPIDTDNIIHDCQNKFPNTSPVLDTSLLFFYKGLNRDNNPNLEKIAANDFENSWSNPINLCVLNDSLAKLPTENGIFFLTDEYFNDDYIYNKYRDYLIKNSKQIISSTQGKQMLNYSNYWVKNVNENFQVSKKELHPNALANKMYADILFDEISTNKKWGF